MNLNKKAVLFFSLVFFILIHAPAQDGPKVYPSNWWVGMRDHALQLMIHGKDIGRDTVVRISYPGVSLRKVQRAESPNYLFLDLYIGPEARPGTVRIRVGKEGADAVLISYPLNARRPGKGRQFAQGV